MFAIRVIFYTLVFLFALQASAETEVPEEAVLDKPSYAPPSLFEYSGWGLGIAIEHLSIDERAAGQEGIDDSALSFLIEGEYFFPNSLLTFVGGLNVISYDDNEAFRQLVEDDFGGVRREKSSASASGLYAELGPKWGFDNDKITLALRGGVLSLLQSERSIEFCNNCFEEDIDIDGGAYFIGNVSAKLNRKLTLGLTLRHYLSGDFENSLGLNLGFRF